MADRLGQPDGVLIAVACDHRIATQAGRVRADVLVKKIPKRAWQTLSAGVGTKGHRFITG